MTPDAQVEGVENVVSALNDGDFHIISNFLRMITKENKNTRVIMIVNVNYH